MSVRPQRWIVGKSMSTLGLGAAIVGAVVLLLPPRARAQAAEPGPCDGAVGLDELSLCWTREVQRAEVAMHEVYRDLHEKLPKRAAEGLERAQKLWLEFRDAHMTTLYGVDDPIAQWGRNYPICVLISQYVLTRARTRELQRILEPDKQAACPL
jgi:uncharacterized protein YecT (DUF1311 family)